MDPRDDDIEFDFFEDEPATTEVLSRESRVRLPRRGGRGTGMRRPDRAGPRADAAAAPAGADRRPRRRARLLRARDPVVRVDVEARRATQHYMARSRRSRTAPRTTAQRSPNALTTPGAKVRRRSPTKLARHRRAGAAERRRGRASRSARPAARREPARSIEALAAPRQRRRRASRTRSPRPPPRRRSGDAALLAAQADRLLASDVVWDDFFKEPGDSDDGRRRASAASSPPDSNFVANPDLDHRALDGPACSSGSAAPRPAATPSGVHGTNIVSTKAQPGDQVLSTTTENTVTASTDLAFVVTVHDCGDSQEVGIKVTLTIQKPGGRDRQDADDHGDQPRRRRERHVLGPRPGAVRPAGPRWTSTSRPSRARRTPTNNKATYPVIFSLG